MTETFVPPTPFAVPGRIAVSDQGAATWQPAVITAIRRETPRASTFRLAVPGWTGHLPGQHCMLRLTADDGYTAQRHYSIASAPDDTGHIELTLDHVPGGEVSGHLHSIARPGDTVEVRGPVSGFFAWTGDRPALLLGAGSPTGHLREARRPGIPVRDPIRGGVRDVEVARRPSRTHERVGDRAAAAERVELVIADGVQVLELFGVAQRDPGEAAGPGGERRVALLRRGGPIPAIVDVEHALV
ncbi:MAG: hypothetical protein QOI83_1319, partial [Streptomycetaceae bacterium]|nr:hypothetical protein [Streptomycetaceae bacterium]